MCVTIRNSMHGVLLLPSLKKQRELIQRPINNSDTLVNLRNSDNRIRDTSVLLTQICEKSLPWITPKQTFSSAPC